MTPAEIIRHARAEGVLLALLDAHDGEGAGLYLDGDPAAVEKWRPLIEVNLAAIFTLFSDEPFQWPDDEAVPFDESDFPAPADLDTSAES